MTTKENEVNDKQPEAVRLADALDQNADLDSAEGGNPAVCKLEWDAATMLRTQHAAIERKDALLRQAEQMMRWAAGIMELSPQDAPGFFDDLKAIKQELSQ